MKAIELNRDWPQYWATHDISYTELRARAAKSDSAEEAQAIWE